jgi:hypothetical protein
VKIRNWKSSDKRNWELMIKVEMVNGVVWIFQYMQLQVFFNHLQTLRMKSEEKTNLGMREKNGKRGADLLNCL